MSESCPVKCPVKGIYDAEPGTWPLATCGRPVVARVEYGCVHEHISSVGVCEYDARRVTSAASWCSACWNGADPHRCLLIGRVVAP